MRRGTNLQGDETRGCLSVRKGETERESETGGGEEREGGVIRKCE